MILERLDRDYVNDKWRMMFPDENLCNHPIFFPDHSPIVLEPIGKARSKCTPYKMEAWCLEKEEVKQMVEEILHTGVRGSKLYSIQNRLRQIVKAQKMVY